MNSRIYKTLILVCMVSAVCLQRVCAETDNAFFSNASVSGKVRTVYYRIDNTKKSSNDNQNLAGAWTGALWLNASSGYFKDTLGIGASAYGVGKLKTLNNREGGSNQLLLDSNKGYIKLGQAWADLKFDNPDNPVSGHIKAGLQVLYTGLISGSGSRSTPTSWQGVNIESKAYATTFKVAWVNRIMLRNDNRPRKLVNFGTSEEGEKTIDYIWGAELSHEFLLPNEHSLTLKYRNAFSKDFLQAHNMDAKWTMPVNETTFLSLNGKIYYTRKNGDLWQGRAWSPAFDDNATVGSLAAEVTQGPWVLRTAITKTRAKSSLIKPPTEAGKFSAPGKYYYDFGENTHGIWDIPTSGFAEDFFYDNELAWMVGASVDMAEIGAQGLKLGYAYIQGSGIEVLDANNKKITTSEYEHDLLVQYAFPKPLKNLSFKLKYGIYRNDEALGKAINKEENDLRVWLDYNFMLF